MARKEIDIKQGMLNRCYILSKSGRRERERERKKDKEKGKEREIEKEKQKKREV